MRSSSVRSGRRLRGRLRLRVVYLIALTRGFDIAQVLLRHGGFGAARLRLQVAPVIFGRVLAVATDVVGLGDADDRLAVARLHGQGALEVIDRRHEALALEIAVAEAGHRL